MYKNHILSYNIRMTLNKAFAMRISKLLIKHNMSKYKLVKESGLTHSGLRHIFNANARDVRLSSVVRVAEVFSLTLAEFFNDEVFDLSLIELD